jgi:hypothetical protein
MAIRKTRTRRSRAQSQKLDVMKSVNHLGDPVSALAGYVAGKYALKKISNSQAVSGLLGPEIKELILPLVSTLGSVSAMYATSNKYLKTGFLGAAAACVEEAITKFTGKPLLSGIQGLLGEEESMPARLTVPTNELPAASIDIEGEVQQSVRGASDFSMSDEPVGNAGDFSMSDEPVGYAKTAYAKAEIMPGEDADLFAGDMLND